jgi:hypothetical protein
MGMGTGFGGTGLEVPTDKDSIYPWKQYGLDNDAHEEEYHIMPEEIDRMT